MGSVNKVILVGNLGRDAELRYTPGGAPVATINMATTEVWNDKAGQKQEKTEWHRVVVWNNNRTGTGLADVVEKYLKKGDRVYVEGRIEYRSYEDKKDGQTKYVTEIKASDLMMMGGRGEGGESGGGRRAAAPAAAGSTPGSAKKGDESFGDYPEALDEEDDDLPF